MIVIIIFIGLIIGLNCIPLLTKTTFPKIEKVVKGILITSTALFLTFGFFEINSYSLKGPYTFKTITLTFILGQPVYERQLDDNNKISVTTGGFLSCGEIINITQTKFIIFDQQIFHIRDLCLERITNIEIIKLNNKHAELLIYHNGERDSESPYKHVAERKKGW